MSSSNVDAIGLHHLGWNTFSAMLNSLSTEADEAGLLKLVKDERTKPEWKYVHKGNPLIFASYIF